MGVVAPVDIMLQTIEILNGTRFQNIKEAQKLGTTMRHAKQNANKSLRNHTLSLMIYYFLLL